MWFYRVTSRHVVQPTKQCFEINFLLKVHRLMLADKPRTSTYQAAIEGNAEFFRGKTVMGESSLTEGSF
jgi:hypothetical protein